MNRLSLLLLRRSLLSTTNKRAASQHSKQRLLFSSVSSSCNNNEQRRLSTTAAATAAHDQSVLQDFPSLVIGSEGRLRARGSFAEAQAVYLDPDPGAVRHVADLLRSTNSGVVAHYYMDVELQGVLQAAAGQVPGRIGVADSLKMGDMAVDMARRHGARQIACLGVDFMSESVQAILQRNGLSDVPVYRASPQKIGCSLAESAEREVYQAWLQTESQGGNALHVIYINTSLETKAVSSSIVPTITCTSSNVLNTLLTASAQVPGLKILYGPDTYMGENLVALLTTLLESGWDDGKIAADVHPQHDRESLERLRDSIAVFPAGNCVVHHMFGSSVVDAVLRNYRDAYVTAHLEVPGEMFDVAMRRSLTDAGVVGSTSDILKFISRKVQEAASSRRESGRLQFVLGTEAGMVTSIVQSVQQILARAGSQQIEAEIVFPVAQDAVMGDAESELGVVPGVAGGEGCSTSGGCATCPYMKMNDLDALTDLLTMVDSGSSPSLLERHLPPDRLSGRQIDGRPAAELGSEPIAYMRAFSATGRLPDELIQKVMQQS